MALTYYVRCLKNFPKHITPEKTIQLLASIRNSTKICIELKFFDNGDFLIRVINFNKIYDFIYRSNVNTFQVFNAES